ncbi:hypothetical protein A9Z42_0025640 [Trichoderma parareesei]|uniref:SSCRP protein n=1 Tax=Trichoderma parareesei TaxID=858221 RepID=A0A2H2ZSE0_TRIPA|nr:hypothetical protein A9Z42_0025640 [Trichoderma parareesei]
MKPIFLTVATAALASALSEQSTDANPPQTLDRVWSGIKQSGSGFTSVTGTITIPKGGKSTGPSIWVGIDGSTECPGGGLLQTGVRLTGNGTAFSWFEWVPLSAPVFEGFAVSEGDDVRMTVHAYGPFKARLFWTTSALGRPCRTLLPAPTPRQMHRCVNRVSSGSSRTTTILGGNDTGIVASPDYGTIVIRNASAQGLAGIVTPEGSELIALFDTRTSTGLSECSAEKREVTCKYIGPPTQG